MLQLILYLLGFLTAVLFCKWHYYKVTNKNLFNIESDTKKQIAFVITQTFMKLENNCWIVEPVVCFYTNMQMKEAIELFVEFNKNRFYAKKGEIEIYNACGNLVLRI